MDDMPPVTPEPDTSLEYVSWRLERDTEYDSGERVRDQGGPELGWAGRAGRSTKVHEEHTSVLCNVQCPPLTDSQMSVQRARCNRKLLEVGTILHCYRTE